MDATLPRGLLYLNAHSATALERGARSPSFPCSAPLAATTDALAPVKYITKLPGPCADHKSSSVIDCRCQQCARFMVMS